MGLIRKTLSVGTLGIVSFRSKKEKLRRAERSQEDAEAALDREHAARVSAEERSIAAEKRVKRAQAEVAHAKRKGRGRRTHKTDRLGDLIAGAEPIVRSGMETARSAGTDAAERGRRVGRRARKAAKRSAIDAKKAAKRSAIDARKTAERGRRLGRRAGKAAKHTASDAKHAAERTLHQAAEAVSSSN